MDAFDMFIIGDTGSIIINFDNKHFIQRLNKYHLSRRYMVDMILEDEPIRYDTSGPGQYDVVYRAPQNKEYKELRVIMAATDNRIDILKVIPGGRTQRQKNNYADKNYKELEKKRNKAYAKEKNYINLQNLSYTIFPQKKFLKILFISSTYNLQLVNFS